MFPHCYNTAYSDLNLYTMCTVSDHTLLMLEKI